MVSRNIREAQQPPIHEEALQQPPAAAPRASTTYIPVAYGFEIADSVITDAIADAQPEPALPDAPAAAPNTSTTGLASALDVPNANSDPVRLQRWKVVLLSLILEILIFSAVGIGGYCATEGCAKSGPPGTQPTSTTTNPSPTPKTPPPTPKTPTTSAPSRIATSNRTRTIVAEINNITLSGRKLAYPPTADFATGTFVPKKLALQCLIERDPLNLLANATGSDTFCLQQRYALLTLWFSSNGKNWIKVSGWLGLIDECGWFGITYNVTDLGSGTDLQNTVAGIELQGNNIQGSISPDLGLLTSLQSFHMSCNSLKETLPASIGQWTALQSFDMSFNALTGTLPSSIGQWTALQSFDLGYNSLAGMLPSSIGQMTALQKFTIAVNALKETLPASIGRWTNLQIFSMAANSLTGTMPTSIGQWTNLQYFDMSSNPLTGTLPALIGQWTALQTFNIGSNSLTGTLPSSIGQWTALKYCDMSSNPLTGPLQALIGQWTALQSIKVYYTLLTGTLPASIGQWAALQFFNMGSNFLTGALPTSIGQWTALEYFYIHNNTLTGTVLQWPTGLASWRLIFILISLQEQCPLPFAMLSICKMCGIALDWIAPAINVESVKLQHVFCAWYSSGLNCLQSM